MENIELKERFIDERTGIEYIKCGDYYLPNLVTPPRKNIKIGKYGRMRAKYLKENKKAEYSIMLIDNTLQDYLIEIDKTANERYSFQGIKERIYYNVKEEILVANLNKKYYKKIYTGPKINRFLLKTSSFYRLYVHYLYQFRILPAKNEYKELSPEYYKQKRKNNMIFEEINFLGRNSFNSVNEVKNYMDNLEKELPELKGKRELLWKQLKSVNESDKSDILKEIYSFTKEIDKIQTQKKVCSNVITKYEEIKEFYKKMSELKIILQKSIITKKKIDKKFMSVNRL